MLSVIFIFNRTCLLFDN